MNPKITTASPPAWNNELHDVLRVLRRAARKWRQAALAFGVVLGLGVLVMLFWPKEWKSESIVYYRAGLQWSMDDAANARRMGERFRDTLLARTLLTKVIEEMGLYPGLVRGGRMVEAVEEMRLAISFEIDQSDVYAISYTGHSPEQAQRVTAKLAEMLIAENARITVEQTRTAQEFLEKEKRRTEEDLASREDSLLAFLAQHPEFATEQSRLGGSLRAGASGAPVPGAQSEALGALRREEDRLRRQLSSPEGARPPQDPTLIAARDDAEAKLRAAQRDLAEKRAAFTEQHPDVRAAETAAQEAGDAYRRAQAALDAAEPRVLASRLNEVQQEIASLRRLYSDGRPARPDPTRSSAAARRVVDVEAEWARLSRAVEEARERFQELENRLFVAAMNASLATSGQSSQIVVIDPAFLPVRPVGISRTAKILLVIVLALVVALVAAFALAMLDDRIFDATDLERLGIAPVLMEIARGQVPGEGLGWRPPTIPGAVRPGSPALEAAPTARRLASVALARGALPAEPAAAQGAAGVGTAMVLQQPDAANVLVRVHRPRAPQQPDPRLVMLSAPESAAAAAYRVLCHRLRERANTKTILVTSPGRGEGKSLCAVNLALALVEGDRARAVLLEMHHQSPCVGRLLGFEPPVGTAEQIEAHRQRPGQPWEVVETVLPKLHAVALAPGSTMRPTLHGSLPALVAALRLSGYEYVVIDGPDALGSADATLMQVSIDGMVMTVRGGVTRARAVRSAVEQVGAGNLAGFALFESHPS